MRQYGIPVGEVRSVGSALSSAEASARGAVVTAASSVMGEIRMVRSPLRFSGTPVTSPIAPPMLGEHTVHVLSEVLKLNSDVIADLLGNGTIASYST